MILETEQLRLRPWTLTDEDVAAAFRIYGDPAVTGMMGQAPDAGPEVTRAGLDRVVGRYAEWPGMGFWAVEVRANGEIVGGAGIKPLDGGPEIEVGYHLRCDAWGRGYATELARALVAYGFDRLGLDRIVGVARPDNLASRRILEKTGLVYLGTRRFYGMELAYYAIEQDSGQTQH